MWRKTSSLYKYFLFLFNLMFVASSLLLVTVGLIIRGQYQKYREFLDEHFFSLPFLLVCVGIILFVITFFGCCGALQENYCMIWMFSILLGLLFIMETTLGFTAYALSDKAHNILSVSLNDTMHLYNKSYEITKVWDTLQVNLHCCGVNTHSDWYPVLNNSLPMSCCEPQTGAVGHEVCNESVSTLHRSSCLDSLSSIIIENSTTLGAVGIGIALGQVLGVFFSCVLARRIRNNYENFE
ncbi:hypothetical protein V9T40_001039 [Parthenolecanium corni]|uniref:Tetraspanin n=1 Tax=Parthenolecanium corni TaxID=536013 RepID=A0AAN9TAV8_9HEMI